MKGQYTPLYNTDQSDVGTDRTFGSDSVRYGDPVYFGRFGFGSDSVGFYRTYAESGARASGKKYQQFRCNNLLIFDKVNFCNFASVYARV